MNIYQPSEETLNKYADLLVNFALGGGKGIKSGQTVLLQSNTSALPLYGSMYKQIIKSGGSVIGDLREDSLGLDRFFYDNASQAQLEKFHSNYIAGLVKDIDHRFYIISSHDVHCLDGIEPQKVMTRQRTFLPYQQLLDAKEHAGKYSWSLALYGTESMAQEAGMSLKDYWEQIIDACYLDRPDPKKEWAKIYEEIARVRQKLTDLKIEKVHLTGTDIDLWIGIGANRKWLGGGGRNVPSYEVFTSPDWRSTEGWVRFNQPVFRYGMIAKDVKLTFKAGRVINVEASDNAQFIKDLIATDEGAAQVGEFSLTDKRLSRITKFMAETLFDENAGGQFGNTHIAVGKSFHDAYIDGADKINDDQAQQLGFNQSSIHCDMVSTADRTVMAYLQDGSQRIIYEKGQFAV